MGGAIFQDGGLLALHRLLYLECKFQDRVIWPIKRRSEPCDPSSESACLDLIHTIRGKHLQTLRHWKPEESGGKTWKEGQDRHSTRIVQIAGQEMHLYIFKSITELYKTKPPIMPPVGKGHSHGSRKQARTQQSSQASLSWFYKIGNGHISAGMPVIFGKDELWSQPCFLQKLRERCHVQGNLLWPPLWSGLGGGVLSCPTAFLPTMTLHHSLRVCLEDSALLFGTAYTCSFSVNNCINFIGSPSLNWLRFM